MYNHERKALTTMDISSITCQHGSEYITSYYINVLIKIGTP